MAQDEADGVPNVARMYDYLLGGAHNFHADRVRAEEVIAIAPSIALVARANRTFLRHAVEHALDLGIRQFLDLGSGIPTVGNVHEVAHRRDPLARVAYVDNESVAVARSRAVLADVDHATITDADALDVEAVLAAPGVSGLLDLSEPVALLAIAILPFVSDDARPGEVLGRYRRALPAGSVLALTQTSQDYPDHPDIVRDREAVVRLYASASNPAHDRSRAAIRALVETAGFRPDGDGLVELGRWGAGPDRGPVGGYALISEPI
jgi:hypothetical protein